MSAHNIAILKVFINNDDHEKEIHSIYLVVDGLIIFSDEISSTHTSLDEKKARDVAHNLATLLQASYAEYPSRYVFEVYYEDLTENWISESVIVIVKQHLKDLSPIIVKEQLVLVDQINKILITVDLEVDKESLNHSAIKDMLNDSLMHWVVSTTEGRDHLDHYNGLITLYDVRNINSESLEYSFNKYGIKSINLTVLDLSKTESINEISVDIDDID